MRRDSDSAPSETFAPCYPTVKSHGSASESLEPALCTTTWRALVASVTVVILLLLFVRIMANG